ncbi:GLPGLI family protein [Panacibacter sp. DH6]|uniref:GLPGLI family protein n=1 Tax=Panacibacter microcysteis TaxID=2793269 RepID=A0A931GYT1_9BACT|nr:GLPGLI family protein [Panacibacter microcysteis]MBG9377622.1 GLPGLI family protein [Panacibacter microcysteis]
MKSVIIITALFFSGFLSKAQNAIFLTQGRIEYEKKINLYAALDDDEDAAWRDLMKKTTPQFKITYFDLTFNGDKTLYQPGRENTDNNRMWQSPAEDNIIFTDLQSHLSTSRKNVYEQGFLISDTARKINWKITDETRTIAGFECRRANALIMDSIYIVAFYTESIIPGGGPESFTGLPGMILGLAIPHEHITWFATKVYNEQIPEASLKAPAKGKKISNTALLTTLQDRMKDWGKWARRYIIQIMI